MSIGRRPGTRDESGWGQSVPHRTRSRFAAISAWAIGVTSEYSGARSETRVSGRNFDVGFARADEFNRHIKARLGDSKRSTSAVEPLERVVNTMMYFASSSVPGLVIICFLLALRCKRR